MAYGAPTNLDLSACNVTATGGSTVQTLADLGKAVGDNAAAVTAAQLAASTAQTKAAAATQSATMAQTTASTALTAAQSAQTTANAATEAVGNLGNTYIPVTSIGAKNGVAQLDDAINLIVPYSSDSRGYITYQDTVLESWIWMNSTEYAYHGAAASNKVQGINAGIHMGAATRTISGVSTPTMYLEVSADVFQPMHITTDLGQSDSAWANIYTVTAPQVTSDKNYKTVEGALGNPTYVDGSKLLNAIFSVNPTVYKLNDAIATKGETNARNHVGFIAQEIEAALIAAGLNPSDYALWTSSPQYELIQEDTGKKDDNGNAITKNVRRPKLDANGKQEYKQMLRYEEVLCVMVGALKEQIKTANATIQSLSNRISALEAKANA